MARPYNGRVADIGGRGASQYRTGRGTAGVGSVCQGKSKRPPSSVLNAGGAPG